MTDKLAISDVVDFYAIDGIGNARNLETHIFQVFGEDGPTDTVEWVAMDDGRYNVFVPYYPMLTTDTYAGYQLSTVVATYEAELPEVRPVIWTMPTSPATVYCLTTGTIRCTGHWTRCPI